MAKIRSRPLKFVGKGEKTRSIYQQNAKRKLIEQAQAAREQQFQAAQKRAGKARHEKQYKPPVKTKPTVVGIPTSRAVVVAAQPLIPGGRKVIDITPRDIVARPVRRVNVPGVPQPMILLAPRPSAGAAARQVLAARRKQKKQAQQNQQQGLGKGRAIANLSRRIPSSWVDGIGYDAATKTLAASLSQILYAWRPVEQTTYDAWWWAFASCVTWDKENLRRGMAPRWWPGKNPSMGAMWHHGGIKRILAGTPRIM